jgi:hypothetical protein
VAASLKRTRTLVAPPGSLVQRVAIAPILAVLRRRARRVLPLARRVVARRWPRRGSGCTSSVPTAAFVAPGRELTTAQLWSVLTVAQLESGLAFKAWLASPREYRAKSHRSYVAALSREERAARILAARAAAEPVTGEPVTA